MRALPIPSLSPSSEAAIRQSSLLPTASGSRPTPSPSHPLPGPQRTQTIKAVVVCSPCTPVAAPLWRPVWKRESERAKGKAPRHRSDSDARRKWRSRPAREDAGSRRYCVCGRWVFFGFDWIAFGLVARLLLCLYACIASLGPGLGPPRFRDPNFYLIAQKLYSNCL